MNPRSGSSRRGRRRGRRNGGATGARPADSSRSDIASSSVAEAGGVTDVAAEQGDAPAAEVAEPDVANVAESEAAEQEVAEPEVTEPEAEVTEAAEPDAAEPEAAEAPKVAEAEATEAPEVTDVSETTETTEVPEAEEETAPTATTAEAEPAVPAAAAAPDALEALEYGELGDEDYEEDVDDTSSWVRPYVWTGGRTDTSLDFALETLVSARKALAQPDEAIRDEHRRVLELCDKPRSVTEIAALLSVPLGVAKTLLGAMAEEDMLVVHRDGRTGPDLALMERVLRGLKNL
ncbi:MAG: DUF742 domain-containing protein [Actinophytocola sp.]|nr:DUF742 domain-containing protein [Actinophytocola sp.]